MGEVRSLYTPRAQFLAFHERSQRWAFLNCHRRAGKTVAGVNELLERGLYTDRDDARYSYVAPFYAQAKAVAWDYLLKFSEPFRVRANIAELSVDLFNGTRCRLFGGDNPDALRGLYHDGVMIDEPAQMKPGLYTMVIRPSLSDRRGWAGFMGTPAGKNEFYDIGQQAKANPKEWFSLTLKASQSGILPQEELDAARADMDEDEYEQEYECSFDAAIRGSFYGKLINKMGARLGHWPFQPGHKVFTAWDLGFTDDTVIWFFQVIHNRPVFFDCYAESGQSIDAYIGVLHRAREEYATLCPPDMPFAYGDYYLPHDARAHSLQTGKSTQEILLKAGVRARIVPELSVQDGIQATRKMLEVCCIDETKCATGVEALRQYQREWDEEKKAFRQKPRHDWCMTADTRVLTRYGTRRIMDLSINDEVATSWGWRAHLGARMTRPNAPLVAVTFADGLSVRCTPDHPFKTGSGWKYAADLTPGMLIQSFSTPQPSISTGDSTVGGPLAVATSATAPAGCTVTFGPRLSALFRRVATFITATPTTPTTASRTLSAWTRGSIAACQRTIIRIAHGLPLLPSPSILRLHGIAAKREGFGTVATPYPAKAGRSGSASLDHACFASRPSIASYERTGTSNAIALTVARPLHIVSVVPLPYREDVWCISVPGIEEFALANGAIVHNTSHYADGMRMGALGWQEDYRPPALYIPEKYRDKPPISEGVQLAELWKTLPLSTRRNSRI